MEDGIRGRRQVDPWKMGSVEDGRWIRGRWDPWKTAGGSMEDGIRGRRQVGTSAQATAERTCSSSLITAG